MAKWLFGYFLFSSFPDFSKRPSSMRIVDEADWDLRGILYIMS
jgi:hypothetical protein